MEIQAPLHRLGVTAFHGTLDLVFFISIRRHISGVRYGVEY
jgi:hypothetical protein